MGMGLEVAMRVYLAVEKVLKVMLFVQGEMNLFECSAIEDEGAAWLVPRWLPAQDDGYAMPERLIRLDQFAHQTLGKPGDPGGFRNKRPPTESSLRWPCFAQLKAKFIVLERPELRYRAGSPLH